MSVTGTFMNMYVECWETLVGGFDYSRHCLRARRKDKKKTSERQKKNTHYYYYIVRTAAIRCCALENFVSQSRGRRHDVGGRVEYVDVAGAIMCGARFPVLLPAPLPRAFTIRAARAPHNCTSAGSPNSNGASPLSIRKKDGKHDNLQIHIKNTYARVTVDDKARTLRIHCVATRQRPKAIIVR